MLTIRLSAIQTRIMTVLLSLSEWFIRFLMPKYSRMLWRSQCSSDNISLQLAYLLGIRHQEDVSKILVVGQKICYHRWRGEVVGVRLGFAPMGQIEGRLP